MISNICKQFNHYDIHINHITLNNFCLHFLLQYIVKIVFNLLYQTIYSSKIYIVLFLRFYQQFNSIRISIGMFMYINIVMCNGYYWRQWKIDFSAFFFDYSVLTFCYALYAVIISFYYSKAGRRNKNYYNVRV